jgi:N-acetylmannosamine-6-phosphate 2-epimerase / N-acetylmannosamine kinase
VTHATLGVDIGGTKILVALVEGERVLAEARVATPRTSDAAAWIDCVAELAEPWSGRYASVGVAATGIFIDGAWQALNPGILPIPEGLPLAAELADRLGRPVHAVNDAQAAAWGEHRFGAGQGRDLVFMTISTGIGGGIVLHGQLLAGIAGSIGQLVEPTLDEDGPIEDRCSGRWVAKAAAAAGHTVTAEAVFAAAANGEGWARRIVDTVVRRVARLLRTIKLLLDPPLIVVGGGIGLAPGFLDEVEAALAGLPSYLRPHVVLAAKGHLAGILGAADLASINQ